MAKSKYKEELTEAMHSEFTVSSDTDQKHATWTALDAIRAGDMTIEDAMKEYGVTERDIVRYKKEWSQLNSD